MTAVESMGLPSWNSRLHRDLGEDRGGLKDSAEWIDEPGDSRVGGAREGEVTFHRAEHDHRKMLHGCRGLTEPGIVGDRDEKFRSVERKTADQVGKDDLIADQYTEPYRTR